MNGLNELLPHLYPFFFLFALFILMYKMVGWARKRKVAAVAAGVLVQMLLPDPNVEKTIQMVAKQKEQICEAEDEKGGSKPDDMP